MKFKIGDNVKITFIDKNSILYSQEADKFIGKIGKICDIDVDEKWATLETTDGYIFNGYYFDLSWLSPVYSLILISGNYYKLRDGSKYKCLSTDSSVGDRFNVVGERFKMIISILTLFIMISLEKIIYMNI